MDRVSADPLPIAPRRRRPVLRYAASAAPTPIAALPMELLRPGNAITLFVCIVLVAIAHALALFAVGGAVPLGMIAVVLLAVLGAHATNVLDEFGPADGDEVPTVLRSASPYEDLLLPLRRLTRASLVCFGPAIVTAWLGDFRTTTPWAALAVPLAGVGLAAFPAVLLTMVEGSTPMNLTPPRLLGLIRASGRDYPVAVALVASALMTTGVAGTLLVEAGHVVYGRSLLRPANPPPLWPTMSLAYATVTSAVYLVHLAAAATGRLHRLHGERFPWLMQRHERTLEPS